MGGSLHEVLSPEKLMDVSDVKVSDEDGFLSRSMTIKQEHDHTEVNSDQSCRQRDSVSAFASRDRRSVKANSVPEVDTHLAPVICYTGNSDDEGYDDIRFVVRHGELLTCTGNDDQSNQRVFRNWSQLQKKKLESEMQPVIGWVSIHLLLKSTTKRCGWLLSLRFEMSPVCTLNFASELSRTECGQLGNFLLTLSQRVFRNSSQLQQL